MRYRLVLFDFDGTLVDSFAAFVVGSNELADRLGFRRVEPDQIEGLRGLGARELLKRLQIPWWKVPRIARGMRRHMSTTVESLSLFPGTSDMLRALRAQGLSLGVVTSNSEPNVRAVLRSDAELVQHWECETSLFGKGARLRRVVRKVGLPQAKVLFVGDELRDAQAAHAAGVPFAAVSWGYTRRDALAAADAMVFDQVADLAAHILDRER